MKKSIVILVAGCLGVAPSLAWAVFSGPPVQQQFTTAAHVIRAKPLQINSLSISNGYHIATFSLVEFEVLEEYKGELTVFGISRLHPPKVIIVACQTRFAEFGPTPPAFELGTEYVLFLKAQDLSDNHICQLVADTTGSHEATCEFIEDILTLKKQNTAQHHPERDK